MDKFIYRIATLKEHKVLWRRKHHVCFLSHNGTFIMRIADYDKYF